MFLCSNCADMIDKNKGIDFPTALLIEWKNDHETWVRNNLNKKIQPKAQPTQVFNVSSTNQQGGITAGVVNVGAQPRQVDAKFREMFQQLHLDKAKPIKVRSTSGDSESFNFATQIKEFLVSQGFTVNGVNQCIFRVPVVGLQFAPDIMTFVIGTRQ